MTFTAGTQPPAVKVKPQSNIYTLLLLLAIIVLAATVGIVIYELITTYGMTFSELFTGQQIPSP